IISMAVLLVVLASGWWVFNQYKSAYSMDLVGDEEYPGAMANTDAIDSLEEKEPIPDLSTAPNDKADSYTDGCHIGPKTTDVKICEYGVADNYDYTVAVVGGSKSAHCTPSIQSFAEEESLRVLNVTKSGCRFYLGQEHNEACIEWNKKLVDELMKEKPDLIVTLADYARTPEKVPEGYVEQFEEVEKHDVPILALRDTPYFSEEIPKCLSENGFDTSECGVDRSETYPEVSAWEKVENPPENVHYADYTDYFCNEEKCPPVMGNVVAYLDKSHMTKTFSESFGPIIHKDVMAILAGREPTKSQNATDTDEDGSEEKDSKSTEQQGNTNLIDKNSTTAGWINSKGELGGNPEYATTDYIEYDPDKEYDLNQGGYIAYYDGDEFIKTVQEEFASTIENVPEADQIRISYHKSFENMIELTEKN